MQIFLRQLLGKESLDPNSSKATVRDGAAHKILDIKEKLIHLKKQKFRRSKHTRTHLSSPLPKFQWHKPTEDAERTLLMPSQSVGDVRECTV